jgi:hypothetical protein
MGQRIRERASWRTVLLRVCGVLVACGALVLVGGCGAGGATTTGTATGLVVLGGGPPQRPGHPVSEAGVVSVFEEPPATRGRPMSVSAGELVARQRVRAGQRFVFRLKAGRYKLNTGRGGRGCPPVTVAVRRGRTTHVDVETLCSIP